VDFDPRRVSYGELLQLFWENHDACRRVWSTQYKAMLFYADEGQRQSAGASAARIAAMRGNGRITTELVPLDRFWIAEDYHQKHALRSHRELAAQVRSLFDSEAEFREAPVATKLNAFCAGDLSRAELDKELQVLGYRVIGDGAGLERTSDQAPVEAR